MDRPLTRVERQAQTRERLVEVASEAFLANGYHATTLDQVAERAGFSKGAVYSNFSGKEELVLAVFGAHFLQRLGRLQDGLDAAEETIEARVEALARWMGAMIQEPEWMALVFELVSSTRDRPAVSDQLVVWERGIHRFVTDLIQTEIDRFQARVPMPAADLATMFVALWSGLSFIRMVNDENNVEVLVDLARTLFQQHR